MRTLTLLGLLSLSLASHATVYKWVDKDGNVHFSDKPHPNAEVVELQESSANQISMDKPLGTLPVVKKAEAIEYQINILAPDKDATIRSNEGKFSVMAEVLPERPANSLWVLRLDGKVWGDPLELPLFDLDNIDRGEHSIEVQLIARNGKVIASSEPRTVFLHRTSVLQQPKAVPLSGN
ncbi:DUF4124 domain-containing protein [Shewanella sp. JM162201]|uniref:DUF4124 domain-containing protein n=1 Tax=Shewanella jiangmenensis TaxID=2837387 RepID=A0ABS5V6I9_9GAMM|nr:DUF4124 domain-containing protein [Shewanella jiangmenensis]MBT1445261.1 DUF4124 domain-containing protein [Shewanella jiangmenensis]